MGCLSDMPFDLGLSRPVMALGLRIYFLFAHLREHPQTYANSLSMHKQIETDFLHILFVLTMNFIPTLPQRERTHVTTPSRDTRSSPYTERLAPFCVGRRTSRKGDGRMPSLRAVVTKGLRPALAAHLCASERGSLPLR